MNSVEIEIKMNFLIFYNSASSPSRPHGRTCAVDAPAQAFPALAAVRKVGL